MEKIKLEICCGTTCYILGASELIKIDSVMNPEWLEHVDINIIPCMGLCTSEDLNGAPYVKINGEIISQASLKTVLDKLQEAIEYA